MEKKENETDVEEVTELLRVFSPFVSSMQLRNKEAVYKSESFFRICKNLLRNKYYTYPQALPRKKELHRIDEYINKVCNYITYRGEYPMTSFECAYLARSQKMFCVIVDSKLNDLNYILKSGLTALHVACLFTCSTMIFKTVLATRNALLKIKDKSTLTALDYSLLKHNLARHVKNRMHAERAYLLKGELKKYTFYQCDYFIHIYSGETHVQSCVIK